MLGKSLSMEIRGVWPIRKARKVVEALQDEAAAIGLKLEMVDVTIVGDQFDRVLILPHCAKHGVPVPVDTACSACLDESKTDNENIYDR